MQDTLIKIHGRGPGEDARAPLAICPDRPPEITRERMVEPCCEGRARDGLRETAGKPPGTAKRRIRRGLVSLRKCLDEVA